MVGAAAAPVPDVRHVEVVGARKSYGAIQALRDADLAVNRGEIHAIVGENGAGKSTMGKAIAGAIPLDSGELLLDGSPARFAAPRDALAHGVTMIAQEISLVPARTVIDNVFLGREPGRLGFVDRRDCERRYEELVEAAGFSVPPHALVRSLRLADQQKVEILRAIARDASLIVMDEPTAALPREDAALLMDAIRRLRSHGTTVIYVSHFLEEVLAIADSVTVMKDGAVVRTAATSEETPDSLLTAMLGRSLDVSFPPKPALEPVAPPVLTVRGLSREPSVRDVSLEVRQGEILGLAGLVGSGRSELARLIFGADRATSGEILIDGEAKTIRSPRAAVRSGLAMIPESRKSQGLVLGRSVRENVSLAHLSSVGRLGLVATSKEGHEVASALTRAGVDRGRSDVTVGGLSGGNQQKSLFAKWLFRQPKLLIADEPTRGVDVAAKRSIYELIKGLAEGGMGVLLISSELEELFGLAHRILVLRSGSIAGEFPGDASSEPAVMAAAFGTVTDSPDAIGGDLT